MQWHLCQDSSAMAAMSGHLCYGSYALAAMTSYQHYSYQRGNFVQNRQDKTEKTKSQSYELRCKRAQLKTIP